MKYLIPFLLLTLFMACHEEKSVDTEKPTVQFSFPQNCDTLYTGRSIELTALISDNEAVAKYQIKLHNNFDHHGHSTEIETCSLDPKKEAINDFRFENTYQVTHEVARYEVAESIEIPHGVDAGDYHLQLTVVDVNGWSSFKILSVKILDSL